MKDLPIFTTDFGVSSLTLRQIPYRGDAYIKVQDVQPAHMAEHLAECAAFCRMAGAVRVYADVGEPDVQVLELRGVPQLDFNRIANLWPVTEQTVTRWRELVNRRMAEVQLAGFLESKDEQAIVSSGGAYFVHDAGKLLGLGWLEGETLKVLASVVPGAGERVAQTILSVTPGQSIRIEVASTNEKALRLYEKLGFLPVAELEHWTVV